MVTDLQLQKLRDSKKRELEVFAIDQAAKSTMRAAVHMNRKDPWSYYREGILDFKNEFFPTKKREEESSSSGITRSVAPSSEYDLPS